MADNGYSASFAAALAQLQMRLPEIKKTETAEVVTTKGSYSYAYANLSTISQQILPILGELGLSFVAAPTLRDGGAFVLECTLRHISGGEAHASYPLPTSGTPQTLGSAITYGRRYCLCAMTGVAPEDDDDASAAEAEAAALPRSAQRARAAAGTRARPRPGGDGPGTAQRARPSAGGPPLPGEPEQASRDQLVRIVATFDDMGIDRPDRLRLSAGIVGRPLASAKELAKHEASSVIDALVKAAADPNPVGYLERAAGTAPSDVDGGEPA